MLALRKTSSHYDDRVRPTIFGNAIGNSIVGAMTPKPSRPSQELEDSIRAANEGPFSWGDDLEEVAVTAQRRPLDNNTNDVIRSGSEPDPDAVRELQAALAREEAEKPWLVNNTGARGHGNAYFNEDGVLTIEITRGNNSVPSPSSESPGILAEGRASMNDYWSQQQDNADSFFGYALAGTMRTFGNVGYSLADMAVGVWNDPGGAGVGAFKALQPTNFGPELFNFATNTTKTVLNGYSLMTELIPGVDSGTFQGFRDTDPYNVTPLMSYNSDAERGGALLANVAAGAVLGKYGNYGVVFEDIQAANRQAGSIRFSLVRPKLTLGEVTTYSDFSNRSVPGDNIFGHEIWQHANMNELGLADTRLVGAASRGNPVIAVNKTTHDLIGKAQRAFNPRAQTPIENIRVNAQILRDIKVAPARAINNMERAAIEHARKQGY